MRLRDPAKGAGQGEGARKATAGLALVALLSMALWAVYQPKGTRAASAEEVSSTEPRSSGHTHSSEHRHDPSEADAHHAGHNNAAHGHGKNTHAHEEPSHDPEDELAQRFPNPYAQWGFHEEYGEFVAAPAELASVPVNEIVKSIRLNGQAVRLGEAVYVRRCASCHGPNLKGIPGQHTPDLTDKTWRFSGDDLESAGQTLLPSDVEWTVRYGVRSGHPYSRGNDVGMLALDPEFRSGKDKADFGSDAFLSAAEIDDMVDYVLQISGQPHDAGKARRAAPLFQDNARGNCFDCHGRSGAGLPIYGSTNLTRKDQYLYGSDRAAIRESIIKGRRTVMPGFEGVLKDEEIKAVSVYVYRGAAK